MARGARARLAQRRTCVGRGEKAPHSPPASALLVLRAVETRRLRAAPCAAAPGPPHLPAGSFRSPPLSSGDLSGPQSCPPLPLGRWPRGRPCPSPRSQTFPPRRPRAPLARSPHFFTIHHGRHHTGVCGAVWSPPSLPMTAEGRRPCLCAPCRWPEHGPRAQEVLALAGPWPRGP